VEPIATACTFTKLVPVTVTEVPTGPLVGVKLVIVGTPLVTEKEVELASVSPGTVTSNGAVAAVVRADAGRTPVTVVGLTSVTLLRLAPFQVIAETPWRFVPVRVTFVAGAPTETDAGLNDVTVGGPSTEKL
jgi:hypothetical protein